MYTGTIVTITVAMLLPIIIAIYMTLKKNGNKNNETAK
jgi:hypothetical protein